MKKDIVLAGVGGQGILTIAALIGRVAMELGMNVKQSEVHGMSQRGGAVLAHLRMSDATILADQIGRGSADVVIAVEPMEALRQAPLLSESGVIITNATPVKNIGDYPETETILNELRANPRNVVIDADGIAEAAGTRRAMNIVMLGAVSDFLELPGDAFPRAIREFFAKKGDAVVEMNLKAFESGRQAAKKG